MTEEKSGYEKSGYQELEEWLETVNPDSLISFSREDKKPKEVNKEEEVMTITSLEGDVQYYRTTYTIYKDIISEITLTFAVGNNGWHKPISLTYTVNRVYGNYLRKIPKMYLDGILVSDVITCINEYNILKHTKKNIEVYFYTHKIYKNGKNRTPYCTVYIDVDLTHESKALNIISHNVIMSNLEKIKKVLNDHSKRLYQIHNKPKL